ncbi:MAG: DUF2721 domain-containing protein [Elusimicrobia bacterium]|nr:DUF2721 domain-containing protein [Elusimicrobiota bacterium]
METTGNLKHIAELIQLAVAPIFLLTAVATTLTLFAGRLARIVDRGRALEKGADPASPANRAELAALVRRAHLIYRALQLGVCAAILVSLLMTLAFAGEVFRFDSARTVAVLFMAALFVYTGALLCLLREVFLAIGSFRLGIDAAAPAGAGSGR